MKKILFFGFAALLLVAFTAPAMAAEKKVTFYGDARFNTYWVKKNDNYLSNYMGKDNPLNKDDSDLLWEMDNADSRFGALFSEGPISAQVELRPNNSNPYRQWWGQWDFGPAQLLVGHTYTPACVAFDDSQFDSESGVVYGDLMSRLRQTQIRLTVPFAMGSFKIAGIQVSPTVPDSFDGTLTAAGNVNSTAIALPSQLDTDVSLPQIEACLTLNVGPATVDLFGGYYSYDLVYTPTDSSTSVKSNIYGIKASVPFGPLTVTGEYYGGKNPGNYSPGGLVAPGVEYTNILYNTATGDTTDSTLKGYGGMIKYKVNDMMSAEVGYFTKKVDRYLQESDDNGTYYLVLIVTPVKGVTIYPEIGVRDEKNLTSADGTKIKQGKRSYVGAYWKISF